ncbi:MAG: amidase [Mycobacteriaceae bacterium]|nr:amidase [Mycobacteriaceae bacterium]
MAVRTGRTAVEIAGLVGSGAVSPVQVATECLARIDDADGEVNAFRLVRRDEVLAEARKLEQRPDLGRLPLAGVPVAIKDHVDVAGCPTRNGSAATSAQPAAADDELVRRLRAAGALVVGKTNVPELCQWPFTETAQFGITRNPHDPTRTAGGSSGGSAAAVAAGMVPIALGSDGGGSIRIPSSCCGVVGLKPGEGLVPGHRSNWLGMSEFGPIAATVADAAVMLDVLSGTDRHRKAVATGPQRPLRICRTTATPLPGVPVHPQVRAAVAAAAETLSAAGHTVTAAAPPWRPWDGPQFLARFFGGVAVDADGLPIARLERRTRAVVRTGRRLRRLRGLASVPPAAAQRFAAWFDDFDVLLTPTLAMPPLAAGAFEGAGMARTLFGSSRFLPYTPPFNLLRYPAMSVPAGAVDGLPIGVQLAAAPGGEGLLLSVAALLAS